MPAYPDKGKCIDGHPRANHKAVMSHLGTVVLRRGTVNLARRAGAAHPPRDVPGPGRKAGTLSQRRMAHVLLALFICIAQVPLAGRPDPVPPLPWPSPAVLEEAVAVTRLNAGYVAGTSDRLRPVAARPGPPIRGLVQLATRSRPVLTWPVNGPVTSGFGPRWGRMHCGIDIGSPAGTPVQAASSGVIKRVAWMRGYGYTLEIDHGGGVTTFYAHLSRVLVGTGQDVEKGQPIGKVGETGRVTGPHLHFELRLDGEAVDPLPYLSRR